MKKLLSKPPVYISKPKEYVIQPKDPSRIGVDHWEWIVLRDGTFMGSITGERTQQPGAFSFRFARYDDFSADVELLGVVVEFVHSLEMPQ